MHSQIAYGIPHKGAPLFAARHDLTASSRSLAKPLTNQSTHVHRKYSAYIHQVISLSRSLAKSTHVLQTWTTPRGMHVHLCDMTHSYMWHDALIFVIRRIIHVTWLIHTCDLTHCYIYSRAAEIKRMPRQHNRLPPCHQRPQPSQPPQPSTIKLSTLLLFTLQHASSPHSED